MKVFIGWSGDRSQQMAQALREWIPLVLHYAEPWVSETDIAAGERWARAVGKELESSSFGILSITRENVGSPWVLFEAGALSKPMEDSRVIPLLLDLDFSEISGPLAQFQAKKAERGGMLEVLQSINRSASQPIEDTRVVQLFEHLWPSLEEKLSSIPDNPEGRGRSRPQHEVLEELVAGVRSLDGRLSQFDDSGPQIHMGRRLIRRPIHPMMLSEIAVRMTASPGDPIALLVLGSAFSQDFPWIYDIAAEAYRAVQAGDVREARFLLSRLQQAADAVLRSPISREIGLNERHFGEVLSELCHRLDGSVERMEVAPAPQRTAARARPRKEGANLNAEESDN